MSGPCRHCGQPIVDPDCKRRWRRRYCDACREAKAWEGKNCGSKNGVAKLTEAHVLTIRRSGESQYVLASKFGVAQSLISRVRNHVIWRHVP